MVKDTVLLGVSIPVINHQNQNNFSRKGFILSYSLEVNSSHGRLKYYI